MITTLIEETKKSLENFKTIFTLTYNQDSLQVGRVLYEENKK